MNSLKPKVSFKKCLCVLLAALFILPFALVRETEAAGDVITYTFSDASSARTLYGVSGATVAFNENEGAVRVLATSATASASFAVSGFDPSYDFAVITYRFATTNSSGAYEGAIALKDGGTTTASASFCYIAGYKYYSSVVDISAAASCDSAKLTFFSGATAGDLLYLYSVSFCKTKDAASSVASSATLAANGPILSKYTESALKTDSYKWQDYVLPYWDTELVVNESLYPLKNQNGTLNDFSLMYSPDRIISVRNSKLTVEYKEGVDYELVNGKLRILSTGSIPCVKFTNHYFTTQKSNSYYMHEVNMSPYKYVRFEEGRAIPNDQLAITYTHSDEWDGFIPANQGESLPITRSRLENGGNLSVIYFGDSITNGGNSSSTLDMAPYAEIWTQMFEREIGALYPHANVSYANTSVSGGGWDGEDATYAGYTHVYDSIVWNNPDLVILALGTNDYQFYSVGNRTPGSV
ncbi:MAG: SGNH/GDSL hydrolase family protein, partial [Clostridia bacterium]|nr:SGNH/GDSL hydrolase family protein [Clostridia bacterium]